MISIIICFYNSNKYLKNCLDSVLNQTFFNYECLMIDDGSTDGSRTIAQEYLKDSRFKLLGNKHIGFPLSKNLGLDNAKGDYICFVDSDDCLDTHYLEYLYKGITETNSDICCCRYKTFKNEIPTISYNDYIVRSFKEKMSPLLNEKYYVYLWNKIFKKELFDNIRHNNVFCLSDIFIIYKLFDKAKKVSYLITTLIYYRRHNSNMSITTKNNPKYWKHRIKAFFKLYKFIYENYPEVKEVAFKSMLFEINLANTKSEFNFDYIKKKFK